MKNYLVRTEKGLELKAASKSCFCPGDREGLWKEGSCGGRRLHFWGAREKWKGAVRWRFTGSNFFCSRVIQEKRQSYSFGTPQKSPSKAKALIKYLIPQAGIIKSCVLKSGV